jgi:hypothetical protein
VSAQVYVPGTGQKVKAVGDDFEDEKWDYVYNLPKSSEENDENQRQPGGYSKNSRWFEGAMRGQPDVVKRVPTPEGGPEHSLGALLMVSRQTGVPGYYSGTMQQDDFICNVATRVRGNISVARAPNVVVRVCLPPWAEWERRNGPSFGFRAACITHAYTPDKKKRKGGNGRFSNVGYSYKQETYWPGFFIHFVPGSGEKKPDQAFITYRAGRGGQDVHGPKITEPGWWTFGMSFSPDGQVHFFAHPGVEPLTAADHISSQYPYGYRCESLQAMFFDVVSGDNGKWSTPWIVDDAEVWVNR